MIDVNQLSNLKVALIADSMTALGGADRHLFSTLKIFPNAHIYTSIYNADKYKDFDLEVKTSFLQQLPFKSVISRHFNLLTPFAFESLDLSEYDLVISFSAGSAKGVMTTMFQKHIGVILTPPRSYWGEKSNIRGMKLKKLYEPITNLFGTFYRIWDYTASKRIDHFVANSKYIQKKVKSVYGVDSDVVYPGIDAYWFEKPDKSELGSKFMDNIPDKYFLAASRLYDYKRIDLAIKAASVTESKLLIVGEGPDLSYLKDYVKELNAENLVVFMGFVSQPELRYLFANAQAMLFCGIEDFGLVVVEAMATGTPVIAYNIGGASETVVHGITGYLFDEESEFIDIVKDFERSKFNSKEVIARAQKFTEGKFVENFKNVIVQYLNDEK